jgi:hypothetical protein
MAKTFQTTCIHNKKIERSKFKKLGLVYSLKDFNLKSDKIASRLRSNYVQILFHIQTP